jgi:hypothetical protein
VDVHKTVYELLVSRVNHASGLAKFFWRPESAITIVASKE